MDHLYSISLPFLMNGSQTIICRMIIWKKILPRECFCLKNGWSPLDKRAELTYTPYIKII